MSDLPTVDAAPRLPSLQAGGAVRAIVPQDFDGAWRIASAVCKAGMAPKGLDTPEKAMVAIMHGMEVGMTPMAALQSIAVVNGRPTIWGDGAIGLVRGSGKCEWIKERIEGEGDNMVAICEVKRKGEDDPIRATFSVADAKISGLWGKSGPWTQYPKRMLAMRARAFALRDGFADILRGLGIAEEVQDYHPMHDVTPQPPKPPAPPEPPAQQAAVAEKKTAPPPPPAGDIEDAKVIDVSAILPEGPIDPHEDAIGHDPETGEVEMDDNEFFERLDADMSVASDPASIEEIWTLADPLARFEKKPAADINQGIAIAIKKRALKRVGATA